MSELELVIRGGEIVTAADRFRADVGVRGDRIVAVAERLERGAREIDASGLLVMPGGIDSHVHLAQPAFVSSMLRPLRSSAVNETYCVQVSP